MSALRVEYRRGTSPEALADLPDGCVDAVVTDPPYGTGLGDHQYGRRERWGAAHGDRHIANDTDVAVLEITAPEMFRVLRGGGVALVFSSQERRAAEDALVAAGFSLERGGLTWDKGRPGLTRRIRYAHESILLAAKGDAFAERVPIISPLRYSPVQYTEHPNEKPVEVLRALIRWACPQGGLVLDPFAGIASCGVAALAEGCSYIGVECDPRWWDIAERRLAEAQDRPHRDIEQHGLFTTDGAA